MKPNDTAETALANAQQELANLYTQWVAGSGHSSYDLFCASEGNYDLLKVRLMKRGL